MINLTASDAAEIYYAVIGKKNEVYHGKYGNDPGRKTPLNWVKHLNEIIEKIGADGENLVSCEPAKVVVCVEGGVVSGAYSTDKCISLEVWDWDDREESEEVIAAILSDKFEKFTEGMDAIL